MAEEELRPCGLVMKGGVTSGVVYPGAIKALSGRYWFTDVGGTSAGAIAAAVTAAAEYGRRGGDPAARGFAALDDVAQELGESGRLLDLFQAAEPVRPLLDAGLAGVRAGGGVRGAVAAVRVLLRRRPAIVAGAVAAALLVLAAAVLAVLSAPVGVALLVCLVLAPLALAAVAGGVAAALLAHVRRIAARLPESGFGMCPGTRQPGYAAEEALTEWLHRHIQAAAGLPLDQPLTFAMLAQREIRMEVMTTDLGAGEPRRLPLETPDYLFDRDDMAALFPPTVVAALAAGQEGAPPGVLLSMPTQDLPVLVATRLSLSFPVLLSAVRLHARHTERLDVVETWLSDGGIASNFPIHFFDAWIPRFPTFGLDLRPAGAERAGGTRWTSVETTGRFLHQVLDTMQNWRDTMQAGLPGYHDRVAPVALAAGEGGLNLQMGPEAIADLMARGATAGEQLLREFDWDRHRFLRYLTLMQLLETDLHAASPAFAVWGPELARGVPASARDFLSGHDEAWCRAAAAAPQGLFDVAAAWGDEPAPALGFARGVEPQPTPAMKVAPRV